MFVVIFEVQPKPERWDDYLATAKLLRPELSQIDGFLDNERYKSERTEGRVLSLSTWRDEKSLVRWRTQATHHTQGQEPGRAEIFADYHLRVGEVTSDSADQSGLSGKGHGGQRFDETEIGAARAVTLTELAPGADEHVRASIAPAADLPGFVDQEWFASITTEGKRVLLVSWQDAEAAGAFAPAADQILRHRAVRIIRDYGMRDRREAPQYFPDVP
jgi:heme-degrading monooxygenase HmoA